MGADADALEVLVRRSQAGDAPALTELRENLPSLVRLDELEAIADQAREAWAGAPGGTARRAARLRALGEATARLARPRAGPLERLLAGRAALASARLADLRRLAERGAEPTARRVRRAERDAATANRTLRAFQELMPAGP